MRIFVAGLLCFCVFGGVQGDLPAADKKGAGVAFAGIGGFNVKKTRHFKIYYKNTPEPARSTAEKVWKFTAKTINGFKARFQPVKDEDGETRPAVKIIVCIVDTRQDFIKVAMGLSRMAGRGGKIDRGMIRRVSALPIGIGQGMVLCLAGANKPTDRKGFFAHVLAQTLLKYYARNGGLPFWISGGFGYYTEFRLFKKTATHYIDYEKSDKGHKSLVNAETLKSGENWAEAIKEMMKVQTKRGDIRDVLETTIATATPDRIAYIYSFMCFLLRGNGSQSSFSRFLRNPIGADPDEQLKNLQTAYKAMDFLKFQKKWHKYITGSKFK